MVAVRKGLPLIGRHCLKIQDDIAWLGTQWQM